MHITFAASLLIPWATIGNNIFFYHFPLELLLWYILLNWFVIIIHIYIYITFLTKDGFGIWGIMIDENTLKISRTVNLRSNAIGSLMAFCNEAT